MRGEWGEEKGRRDTGRRKGMHILPVLLCVLTRGHRKRKTR